VSAAEFTVGSETFHEHAAPAPHAVLWSWAFWVKVSPELGFVSWPLSELSMVSLLVLVLSSVAKPPAPSTPGAVCGNWPKGAAAGKSVA
jgi:hypothetical protein